MPQPLVGHERHAILNGIFGTNVEDVGDHQLTHRRGFGGPSFEDDLARVIAFGKNAHHISVFNHYQRADILLRHQLQRRVNRGLWRNGPDIAAFLPQQFFHCIHERILRSLSRVNVLPSIREEQAKD